MPGIFEEIDIKHIVPSQVALRTHLGDISQLAKSIRERGLLQPICVRRLEQNYEVIAGNRRLAACKELKWKRVLCHVIEATDQETFELALIENVQRKSLDPLDEARALRKYVEERGWGAVSELAAKICKSPAYVSKRIRLLELPQEVLDELFLRRKAFAIAQELLTLDNDKRKVASRIISELKLSFREARMLIKQTKETENQNKEIKQQTSPIYDVPSHQESPATKKKRIIARALDRSIITLRITLFRLDEVIDQLGEDEEIITNVLMQHRLSIHNGIDSLLKIKKRLLAALDT